MSAWLVTTRRACPGIVGMRRSTVIRLRPCTNGDPPPPKTSSESSESSESSTRHTLFGHLFPPTASSLLHTSSCAHTCSSGTKDKKWERRTASKPPTAYPILQLSKRSATRTRQKKENKHQAKRPAKKESMYHTYTCIPGIPLKEREKQTNTETQKK